MGFFSGFRRKIKKLIPKEVRPFLPYAAAMIPGIGGLAGGYGKFVNAALTRGLTDDEADLKDILRTGTFAAAPNIVDSGIGKLDSSKGLGKFLTQAGKANDKGVPGDSIREMVQRYSDPSGFKDTATVIGGQTILDTSAQASDKLDEYNKRMREQGIGDKKSRRAAIRKIYEDAGTWDMDEVDAMLDSYGYRTGGRVGYAEGSYVPRDQIEDSYDIIEKMDNELNPGIIDQIPFIGGYEGKYPVDKDQGSIMIDEIQDYKYGQPPGSFNSSGEIPERAPMSMEQTIKVLEDKYDQAVEEGYGLGEFESMGVYSKDDIRRRVELGYDSAKSNMSNTGIMRAAKGGRVGYKDGGFEDGDFMDSFAYATKGYDKLKELEDEYELLPIRELTLANGGEVMDMNMQEQIDTPSGDMMMDKNTEVASNPEVMDSLNELSLMLFRRPLDQLSEDEYEELKDFAGQTALKPGLIDEYRNYKMGQEDAGQPVLSPTDYFRMDRDSARMGASRGGIMDVNTNMELDIPGMGREDIDVNSMESIESQTAGPEWYQERIQNLEYLFGDELTDEEIADIAYDSDKYYEKVGYDPMKKGGRVGKNNGGMMASMDMDVPIQDLAEEFEITFGRPANSLDELKDFYKQKYEFNGDVSMMERSQRTMAAQGGLMSMGGNEMDLRGGGFVPMGAKERADDVPARLSKNEFVMTADAVRAAGGGSVQKGADLMYDQMKRLEGQA